MKFFAVVAFVVAVGTFGSREDVLVHLDNEGSEVVAGARNEPVRLDGQITVAHALHSAHTAAKLMQTAEEGHADEQTQRFAEQRAYGKYPYTPEEVQNAVESGRHVLAGSESCNIVLPFLEREVSGGATMILSDKRLETVARVDFKENPDLLRKLQAIMMQIKIKDEGVSLMAKLDLVEAQSSDALGEARRNRGVYIDGTDPDTRAHQRLQMNADLEEITEWLTKRRAKDLAEDHADSVTSIVTSASSVRLNQDATNKLGVRPTDWRDLVIAELPSDEQVATRVKEARRASNQDEQVWKDRTATDETWTQHVESEKEKTRKAAQAADASSSTRDAMRKACERVLPRLVDQVAGKQSTTIFSDSQLLSIAKQMLTKAEYHKVELLVQGLPTEDVILRLDTAEAKLPEEQGPNVYLTNMRVKDLQSELSSLMDWGPKQNMVLPRVAAELVGKGVFEAKMLKGNTAGVWSKVPEEFRNKLQMCVESLPTRRE